MADEIKKSVIVRVDIDTSAYTKELKILNAVTADMVKENAALKKSGDILSDTYVSNQKAIANNKKEISDLVRVINNAEKANGSYTGSEVQLKAALSASTYEWSKETEVTAESAKRKGQLAEQVLNLSTALKANETAVGNNYRNVGNYKQAIIDAYKEMGTLKKEINQIGFVMAGSMTKIDEGTKTLKAMADSGKTGTTAYTQLDNEIKELNSTLGFQQEAFKTANTALKQTEEGLKPLEKEAAKIGFVFGQGAENIGDLKRELKEAKSEMIAVATASGMDSKEFKEAADKAGHLKDKLDDVNKAAKSAATGSDLGKFKNQLKDVGTSLLELDFKEAAERAKVLSLTAKSFTWSSMIEGGKALAVTMYELAASMFALPIIWVAAGIAALVGAWYLVQKVAQDSTQAEVDGLQRISDTEQYLYDLKISLAKTAGKETERMEVERLKKLKSTQDEQILKLEELEKYKSKIFDEGGQVRETISNRLNDDQKKQLEELRKAQTKSIADIAKAENEAAYKKINDTIKNTEKIQAETEKLKEKTKAILEKQAQEEDKINQKRIADNLRYLKEIEDQKISLIKDDELREIAKATLDNQRKQNEIKESLATEKVKNTLSILQAENYERQIDEIKNKHYSERQKAFDKAVDEQIKSDKTRIDAATKAEEEIEKAHEDSMDAFVASSIDAMNEESKQRDKLKHDEISGVQQLEKQLSDTIFSAQQAHNQRELQTQTDALTVKHDSETASLQAQLTSGAITQAQFDAKKLASDKKLAADQLALKRKAFEDDKKLKTKQIGINLLMELANIALTASEMNVGGIAYFAVQAGLAAGRAAIEIGGIQSAQFAGGGKALSGKRISSNDGKRISMSNGDNLLATVRTGEVILNEHQQKALGGANTFRAIGVPGFAGGGSTDGGILANKLTGATDNYIAMVNMQTRLNRTLPAPVVYVESILESSSNHVKVISRGDL